VCISVAFYLTRANPFQVFMRCINTRCMPEPRLRGQSQGARERRNEAREPKGNRMTPRQVRGKATWTRTLSVDFRLGGLSGEGRRSIPEGESKKPPPRDWLGSDNDLCIRVLNTHRRLLGGGLGSHMSCVTKDAVRMHCPIRMGMHQMHRHCRWQRKRGPFLQDCGPSSAGSNHFRHFPAQRAGRFAFVLFLAA
jgi:hypothetical protein